ncbi:DUF7402 domain-containing protein [Quadrisphaera granulorum]|uniref:DUF7402 domain-containing protein n=1 Tax=Quadrisphaera granulorum TaxID=317664 RepID=UPI0011B53076|nr:family 16 glycosylhydrolase [Quadrisphaera granulorum]
MATGVWWWQRPAGPLEVTASASAGGTDPAALLKGDVDGGAPADGRAAAWRSEAPGVGQWVQLTYARPQEFDRVRMAPATADEALRAALVVFDSGASLLVHAGTDGVVDVSFPARSATTVRVVVAEAASDDGAVALAGLRLDDSADSAPKPLGPGDRVQVTTSSGDGGAALTDGDPAKGDAGAAWTAGPDDSNPSVTLAWGAPRVVTGLQVMGPATAVPDPKQPAAAQLSGVLRFDDGSSVVVSGIEGGSDQPTTVAFSPRVASRAVLELQRVASGAPLGLREVSLQGEGTTPPVWPSSGPTHTVEPTATTCAVDGQGAATGAPTPDADHPVVLLCPTVGSAISGRARIVVGAATGTTVSASAATAGSGGRQGPVTQLATAVADAQGRAVLEFATDELPSGPIGVQVDASGAFGARNPLRVPLVNLGGRELTAPSDAPRGMTLQWSDDFDTPLSATIDGDGAVYAARKPTIKGGETFGDAGFGDPGDPASPLATLDPAAVQGGYLRMRADDGSGGGERYASLLSSLRVGAGGFAAQYGYFEARMLGGPGLGSWPAFWALNTQSATADSDEAGEADAVELYGHNTTGSCHSTHDYSPDPAQRDAGTFTCLDNNGFPDWSLTWHTYGMRITPDTVTYFIDGTQVAEQPKLGRSQEPYFFLLDQALGGGWPVDLSPTSGLTDTYVDWVRIYT